MNDERKCLAFLLILILIICAVGFFLYGVMVAFFSCLFAICYLMASMVMNDEDYP